VLTSPKASSILTPKYVIIAIRETGLRRLHDEMETGPSTIPTQVHTLASRSGTTRLIDNPCNSKSMDTRHPDVYSNAFLHIIAFFLEAQWWLQLPATPFLYVLKYSGYGRALPHHIPSPASQLIVTRSRVSDHTTDKRSKSKSYNH